MDYIVKCDPLEIGVDGRCLVEVPRYRRAEPQSGDRAFIWVAEGSGGKGLSGVATVEAVADGDPTVLGLRTSDAAPLRPLNKAMLSAFRDHGESTAEGSLAAKLYRHSLLKVAELGTAETRYLESFFAQTNRTQETEPDSAQPVSPRARDWSEYWAAFDRFAEAAGVRRSSVLTKSTNYYRYLGGSTTAAISAFIAKKRDRIGVYVALWRPDVDDLVRALEPRLGEISAEVNGPVSVDRHGEQTMHYSLGELDADAEDRPDWERQHQWLSSKMAAATNAFEARLRSVGAFDAPADYPLAFQIVLGRAYYDQGFINPGATASRYLGEGGDAIRVSLGEGGLVVNSQINRTANPNRSVRVVGDNRRIAEWFQANYRRGDTVQAEIRGQHEIVLHEPGAAQAETDSINPPENSVAAT